MYRVNTLKRNILITPDEVIFHAPTKNTLDPRTILNSIIIAEERYIVPALGQPFYDQLCNQKNTLVTSANLTAQVALIPANLQAPVVGDIVNAVEGLTANNTYLWNQILWKLIAECVMLVAYPEGFVQFGSEGTIHTAPQGSAMIQSGAVTPSLKSMQWAIDKKMMLRIDPLLESLHKFICNQNLVSANGYFPLYTKPCECDLTNVVNKKTGFILGVYEDDDEDDNPFNCNCNTPGFNGNYSVTQTRNVPLDISVVIGTPAALTYGIAAGQTTIINDLFINKSIQFQYGGQQLPNQNPGDGSMYFTKGQSSNTIQLSTPLLSGFVRIIAS